ncbi:YhcN/YlaJ family sporulation lipoprotein [Bacillus sp. FJAT-27445]|uniref:YhcN/YlaJ family sporulation lipoprotein n=1 Tax=Bacillus sp. FJAT-27445 TaxID=1679166 RepID=UPI000743AFE5|nr:YhcN/YlaJ family sporulation lipoprotein [Bacillus sp. FJAT-27445]
MGEYSGTGIGGGSIAGLGLDTQGETGRSFGTGNGSDGNLHSEADQPEIVMDSSYPGISASFKQRIADQIRNTERNIKRVFISFNPDFYRRMNRLADDINNGQNGVNGDFRRTVTEIFENR